MPGDDAFEDGFAVRGPENGFAGALWMGHETGDVAALVADASDVVDGAVWIGHFGRLPLGTHIAPEHLIVCLEAGERFSIGEVAAFAMRDGNAHWLRRNR